MGIDRYVPVFGERLQRADVIEMTMRQDDGGGPAASTETSLRGRADVRGGGRQSRIDQRPAAIAGSRRPNEHHVDDRDLPIGDVSRDLAGLVVASPIGVRVIGRRGFGEDAVEAALEAVVAEAPPAELRYRNPSIILPA